MACHLVKETWNAYSLAGGVSEYLLLSHIPAERLFEAFWLVPSCEKLYWEDVLGRTVKLRFFRDR